MSTSKDDYRSQALKLMTAHPFIDSHVDLPVIMRAITKNPVETVKMVSTGMPGHADLPRMRAGKLGGIFMSVWIPCQPGDDYTKPCDDVRDALEQIDLIQLLMKESDFQYARTSADVNKAFKAGKIATLIGVEGGHMLGNSLSVLRIYAQLGVRYLTLTHTNHNAFASSAGSGDPIHPVHPGNGLSKLGPHLIFELNRLGIMIDLSHVSDETMRQSIKLSKAPVIFSHSNARAICEHPRNVPDDVLEMLGSEEGQNPGVVQVVFLPNFVDPENPTLERVADHIEYLGRKIGKAHVGIASDFDGMVEGVKGLEDQTKYPDLITEVLSRGWTEDEVIGLMGGNLMRVMEAVDKVEQSLATEEANSATYDVRPDLPAPWGGIDLEDYSEGVRRYIRARQISR